MAHFRGQIWGGTGRVSRTGHRKGGLTTEASSWQGMIQVVLRASGDGTDYARVTFERHCSRGTDGEVIYDGPVAGRLAPIPGAEIVKLLAEAHCMLLDLCDGYPDRELHRSPSVWAEEAGKELARCGWDVSDD